MAGGYFGSNYFGSHYFGSNFFSKSNVFVGDAVAFAEIVTVVKISPQSVSDHVAFSEVVGFTDIESISDDIAFSDAAVRIHPEMVADAIAFSEAHAFTASKLVVDIVAFGDAASPQLIVHFSPTDAIAFGDGAIVIPPRLPCDSYSTTLGFRKGVVLSYPYLGASTNVSRSPMFGNEYAIDTNVVVRRTRSGQLLYGRSPHWPIIERMVLEFNGLSKAQVEAIEAFAQASAAKQIGYLDQDARQWQGLIESWSIKRKQVGRGCQYDVGFQFLGGLA